MYSEKDFKNIQREIRSLSIGMGAVFALFLAAYLIAIVKFGQWAMLAVLLAGFFVLTPVAALRLRPLLRYCAFIRDVLGGTRHGADGTISAMDDEVQMQDGVRVYEVRLRSSDGDERIFYINISKINDAVKPGAVVHVEHFGRHITAVMEAEQC